MFEQFSVRNLCGGIELFTLIKAQGVEERRAVNRKIR